MQSCTERVVDVRIKPDH